jgi:hypothetical protein
VRLAIGDVHGRDGWKKYLEEDFSRCFFVGDYFDSFNLSFRRQYRNFLDICGAARKDRRIRLCMGNHDYHYMAGVRDQWYSGFQEKHYRHIQEVLEENMDLLRVLYVTEDRFIISHAGVSATCMAKMEKQGRRDSGPGIDHVGPDPAGGAGIEGINEAFLKDRNILNNDGRDIYGDDVTQGPLWIRPDSLLADHVPGYSQIVGHTGFPAIQEVPLEDEGVRIVFIDTGDTASAYRF